MLIGRHMDEFEIEEEDGGNPPIDRSVWLDVGVAKHTFDVTCIHFDNEFADSDKVKAGGTECTEETVKFDLGL